MIQQTQPASKLTPEAQAQFEQDGYCVVDGLFSEAELQEMDAFFEAYRKNPEKVFHQGKAYEEIDPGKELLRAMFPHRYSDQALAWFLHPEVCAVLQELFGGKRPLGAQTMFYYKPPQSVGQGMHQDDMYLLTEPANCLAAWTLLDDADEENGCMRVIPGSHRLEVMCPDKPGESMQENSDWERVARDRRAARKALGRPVHIRMKRGQTLFFGGRLIHGSGPNKTTDRSRRTFIGHYVDEATDKISKYYHPILDTRGETVSRIQENKSGGPCADGWEGRIH